MKPICTHIEEIPVKRLVAFVRKPDPNLRYRSDDKERKRALRAEAYQFERLSQRQGYTANGSGQIAELTYRHQLARERMAALPGSVTVTRKRK